MKYFILVFCFILCDNFLYGQESPKGTWSAATDANGNAIDSKKTPNIAWQLTVFSFKDEKNYSFLYEEYDAAGKKSIEVKEAGTYTYNSTQLLLSPKTSTTSFYSYLANSVRPVSSSVKQNPVQSSSYLYEYQNIKSGQQPVLIIEALIPGYREGIFKSSAAKSNEPLSNRVRIRLTSAARAL